MSNLEDKAVDLLDKLETLAEKYTPETIDAALAAVSVSGIGDILFGVFGLVGIAVASKPIRKLINYMHQKDKDEPYELWDLGLCPTWATYSLVTLPLSIAAICNLLDIWNWVAIFQPKLALAHQIMGL